MTYKLADHDFINYISKYDILLLFETWTSHLSPIDISGFEAFPSHRPKINKKSRICSGGVIIYVKNYLLQPVSLVKNDTPDMIC